MTKESKRSRLLYQSHISFYCKQVTRVEKLFRNIGTSEKPANLWVASILYMNVVKCNKQVRALVFVGFFFKILSGKPVRSLIGSA
jgi:hypothetical protein